MNHQLIDTEFGPGGNADAVEAARFGDSSLLVPAIRTSHLIQLIAAAATKFELCGDGVRQFCESLGLEPPTQQVDVTITLNTPITLTLTVPYGWDLEDFPDIALDDAIEDFLDGLERDSKCEISRVQIAALPSTRVQAG